MALFSIPGGQLPVKQRASPEQLNSTVKAETPTASPSFHGGAQQWQPTPHGSSALQCQSPGLARMASPHVHSPASAAGQSSPKLEHQLYGEREREASYEEYSQVRKRCKVQDSIHTNSSQMQSQLLSSRGPPGTLSPAMARDSSAPGPKYGDSSHTGNRVMSRMAPGPLSHSVSSCVNALDEPSPLGLTLRKTPSLLDLISMKLAQGGGNGEQGSGTADSAAQDAAKNRPTKCLVPSVTAQDKLKASNFPASSLKVGTWERTSRYEGDLVGKCYYAKRKLVWEVLESGLKSKIEIQWSDISAMKASCPENLPGTLEIEVSRPPLFFRETNPQPRKHTLWQAAPDFTGGQATICKRHYLQFPEGVLNRHYEKLVQCDPRLKALVEGALSKRPSADFEQNSWMFEGKHQHLPAHQPLGHRNGALDGNGNELPVFHPRHLLALSGSGLVNLGGIPTDLKAEVSRIKMQSSDLASPSSVMDPSDSGASDTEDLRLPDSDLNEYDIDFTYPNPSTIGTHDLPDVKPSCNNLFMIGENAFSQDMKLAEIRRCLLEEGGWSNEQQLMLNPSRLGQLSAALAEELPTPLPPSLEASDTAQLYPLSAVVKNEAGPEDHHNWSATNGSVFHRDPSFNSLMSCFSRHGSASDLLLNIPRVASLPRLFEAPPQVSSGRYDLQYARPSYLGSDKLR
ncbi:unnamed protein product [Calypogeia fissa]